MAAVSEVLNKASIAKKLSPAQREIMRRGGFSGDFTMATVRALKGRGLFFHNPTSPNGRCGPMELTELGHAVREIVLAKSAGEQS